MDGLPFQLPPQVGTELFPNVMEAPPIMTTEIEEPEKIKDSQLDPRQGSEENSYGMEDDQSPRTVGDTTPPAGENSLRDEAVYAAQKVVESAQGQIRGWYMGQKHNGEISGLVLVKTSGSFSWGRAVYTKAMQLAMLELKISAAAINTELWKLHKEADWQKGPDGKAIFSHLMAVQFDDGAG